MSDPRSHHLYDIIKERLLSMRVLKCYHLLHERFVSETKAGNRLRLIDHTGAFRAAVRVKV